MIKGHGVDRYWTDTEVYRCIGGNAQLANCFQEELGNGVVHTGITVTGIFEQNSIVSVELAYTTEGDLQRDLEPGLREPLDTKKPKKLKPVHADEVILAIPPSVWHLIDFKNKDLRLRLGKAPHLGVNTKNLFALKKRFWQNFASSPTLTDSNGPADMTWETTEDTKHQKRTNRKPDFAFVAFSGAAHSQALLDLPSDAARRAALQDQLRNVYPGIDTQIEKSKFMDWPHKLFTQGSYYFPAPNEVTAWGPFWKTGYLDWLHFAGEHTSYAFMGYMEGALSSGFRLAHRLAVRDKLLP
jgi:monoamine oxidase